MLQNATEGKKLWEGSEEYKNQSNIAQYMKWLKETKNLEVDNYEDLWKWSVDEIETFWESLWDFFEIKSSSPYKKVLNNRKMPGAKWFEGAKLNYTEHVFRHSNPDEVAIISKSEIKPQQYITWKDLYEQVASFVSGLKALGVKAGDRVVAYIPNIPDATIAFLACASIGAIWSSCSPDFGSASAVARFKQIEPKVFIAVDGYRYGGKDYDCMSTVKQIQEALPSLEKTILVPYLNQSPNISALKGGVFWKEFMDSHKSAKLTYEQVPFDHPLWILYSSGTTGLPKAIVQGQGGVILEHLKSLVLQLNLTKGDRFFWYTTTGWMMWNLLVGGLLTGATIILYDGKPSYPSLDTLWEFAEETKMNVFGISASFLISGKNKGLTPKSKFNFENLRCVASTGSPLPPDGFEWVYENIKSDLWLVSSSGGTDICSSFVTGSPILPVFSGEIQCRALGAKVEAYDEVGNSIVDEVGELVVIEPMPSMPLYFWNDEDNKRYISSYFDTYSNVWRHGDWIKISSKGTCQIYGRSDSTINRGGIRMGTSEIYSAVEEVEGIIDSLVVDITNYQGDAFMPLFVVLDKGVHFDKPLKDEIINRIRKNCSPRHVPNEIYEIREVPRTLNGKKLEVPIKKILMGIPLEKSVNMDSVSNNDALNFFTNFEIDFK